MTDQTKTPNPTLRQQTAHVYGLDGGDGLSIAAYLYTGIILVITAVWLHDLLTSDLTMEWSIVLTVIFGLFALMLRFRFYAARMCLRGLCPICEEAKHEWRH
jgi:hypothetical protein